MISRLTDMETNKTSKERLIELTMLIGQKVETQATRLSMADVIAADALVKQHDFKNRSELIRHLIRQQVKREPVKLQRQVEDNFLKFVKTEKGKGAFVPLDDPRPAIVKGNIKH